MPSEQRPVFVSYASGDRSPAERVCSGIEASGTRCWIAPRDITPGEVWGSAIVEAINTSAMMVVVFSSRANESPQVLREIELAVAKRRTPLIPFKSEAVAPTGAMEYFLSPHHWLDASTPPLDAHIDRLVSAVRRFLTLAGSPSGLLAHERHVRDVSAEIDPSRAELTAEFVAECRQALEDLRFDSGSIADVLCVVTELVANAVEHGSAFDPAKRVRVDCGVGKGHACVTVHNQGSGFAGDETLRQQMGHVDASRPRGRGLQIVRFLSARLVFSDSGRTVQAMVMKRPHAEAPRRTPRTTIGRWTLGDVVVMELPQEPWVGADHIEAEIEMMLDLGTRKFALDWEGVYATPSSLMTAVLVRAFGRVRERGGRVAFFNVNGRLYQLLKMLRFSERFRVCATLDHALQCLAEPTGEGPGPS